MVGAGPDDFVVDTAALELDSQLYREPMKFGVQD